MRASDKTNTTRRAAIGAIAAAAFITPTAIDAQDVLPPNDPVFKAATRYQNALQAYETACNEGDDHTGWEAPMVAYMEAATAFGRTVPTTPMGAATLLHIALEDTKSGDMLWHSDAFESVLAGLQIMAGCDPADVLPERGDAP